MSFPRYKDYKDTGSGWLGAVPEHWAVQRIGFWFNERREKVSDREFPALSVTKSGIVPQLDTAAKSDDGDNRKRVAKGDFVINSRSDRKGSAGASDLDGSVSLICTVLCPQQRVHTPFIHHLLRSQPFQEEYYRNGKGIVADLWSTGYSEMRNIVLGMPPLGEQRAIAAFLDRETKKTDELIEAQQHLIALLKEKRQTVISHAVTRGLNRDAPMKPSGIEWLGQVPMHWGVAPLKRFVSTITDGAHISPDVENGAHPFVSTKDVGEETIDFENCLYTSSVSFEYMVKTGCQPLLGDVLFSKDGTIGRTVVVRERRAFVVASSLIIIRPDRNLLDSDFLNRLCQSHFVAGQVESFVKGAGLPRLSIQNLVKVTGCFPPLAEQIEIAAFVAENATIFDSLITEAQLAIDLLQERRTALISSAVIGQIDVRGFAELATA